MECQPAIQTVTLRRYDVLFHHEDPEGPLIADWRLRISDLELMNSFSNQDNPQSAIRNERQGRTSFSHCHSLSCRQ